MIRKHEQGEGEKQDVWAKLAAPLPKDVISWRQDGRPVQRDGKYFARFVAYIDSNTVRERLDSVLPGEWDLTLELLPAIPSDEPDDESRCAFKARLQALGVIREDVGYGRDYKSASTDAFKRAGVRFGIGHELYSFEQNWVQVDGDGKYAKPLEDPGEAYQRRIARRGLAVHQGGASAAPAGADGAGSRGVRATGGHDQAAAAPAPSSIDERAPLDDAPHPADAPSDPLPTDEPSCPKCGGRMWDNRLSKRNPKAPDFKCRSRSCDGVIWPPRAAGYEQQDIGGEQLGI